MIILNEYFSTRNKILAILILIISFSGFTDSLRSGFMSVGIVAIIFIIRIFFIKIKLGSHNISIYTYYKLAYSKLELVNLLKKKSYVTVLLRENEGKMFAFSLSYKSFSILKEFIESNQEVSEEFKIQLITSSVLK